MTNMFDNVDIDTATADTIVGDGKQYKTHDDLARGKLHGDKHIKELQRKLDEAETKIAQGKTLAEVEALIKGQSQNSQQQIVTPAPVVTDPNDAAALEQRLNELLNKRQTRDTEENNRQLIRQTMVERFKDKAPESFAQIAESSGMSTQELESLASRNPKAFFKLAGFEPQLTVVNNRSPSQSTVNPQALNKNNTGKLGTKSYWDKVFKDNPEKQMDPKVQRQMIKDFDKDPDYFENN